RDLQVSGELQESICRNKTTAYLLNAIPLPTRGRGSALAAAVCRPCNLETVAAVIRGDAGAAD
ncbi:hypothetical protein, partial [Sinorhizobium meliloti]